MLQLQQLKPNLINQVFKNPPHWLTGPLDWRRVVVPSRPPSLVMSQASTSKVQLSNPTLSGTTSWTFPFRSDIRSVICMGADTWQPDEVLHALVLILADNVHVGILKYACHGFCCRCFAAESGSSLIRLAQSWTSVFQESMRGTDLNDSFAFPARKFLWKKSNVPAYYNPCNAWTTSLQFLEKQQKVH